MAHPAPSTVQEMQLAAGCQFRGADDTLPLVVANLVALGFDLIYLVDHRNEDIPLPLLQRLTEGRCLLRVIRKDSVPFAQAGVHSLLMRLAQAAGAHAYLPLDADEFPAPLVGGPPVRETVHRWLVEARTGALMLPVQNHLQRRDIDRWTIDAIDAPVHRVIGAAQGVARSSIGYFGRAPTVKALARLVPNGLADRWVRFGGHQVYQRVGARRGEPVAAEVSPDLVLLHLPFSSRHALDARRSYRTGPDGTVYDNRDGASLHWDDVSMPADHDDPLAGPPVRTAASDAFARLNERLAAAGLTETLRDRELVAQRVTVEATEADQIFAIAADILTATILPRDDGIQHLDDQDLTGPASDAEDDESD